MLQTIKLAIDVLRLSVVNPYLRLEADRKAKIIERQNEEIKRLKKTLRD